MAVGGRSAVGVRVGSGVSLGVGVNVSVKVGVRLGVGEGVKVGKRVRWGTVRTAVADCVSVGVGEAADSASPPPRRSSPNPRQ